MRPGRLILPISCGAYMRPGQNLFPAFVPSFPFCTWRSLRWGMSGLTPKVCGLSVRIPGALQGTAARPCKPSAGTGAAARRAGLLRAWHGADGQRETYSVAIDSWVTLLAPREQRDTAGDHTSPCSFPGTLLSSCASFPSSPPLSLRVVGRWEDSQRRGRGESCRLSDRTWTVLSPPPSLAPRVCWYVRTWQSGDAPSRPSASSRGTQSRDQVAARG
eukprot:353572-Chlamydomonas_euryale.AAC.6